MQKYCLPREAANSTLLGGLVIAPSCPTEIILAVISSLGLLFSSRRVRGLQAGMCNLLHLGNFPRLRYFDHEHPRCFQSVSTKGLSQLASARVPVKVKGPAAWHGTVLRPCLLSGSCQSKFNLESTLQAEAARNMGCVPFWCCSELKLQLGIWVCTAYSTAKRYSCEEAVVTKS